MQCFPKAGALVALLGLCAAPAALAFDSKGKLLATSGMSMVEGGSGGGVVPWATIGGYGTEGQPGASAFYTHVDVQDYQLDSYGAAFAWDNRYEISIAHHEFDIKKSALPSQQQNVFGAKVRLAGDILYTRYPQISAGLQYKRNTRFAIPQALGASSREGVDLYVAATKVFLAGLFDRHVLANGTIRRTKANQLGLLGFGGNKRDRHEYMFEGTVGLMVRPDFVIGAEFREKPDNLSAAQEQHWRDFYAAWFPNKSVSVLAAFAKLGSIAGEDHQEGLFASIQFTY